MLSLRRPGIFGGRFLQILAIFSGSVNIIADGMQYGWSAPIMPILQSKETPVLIQKRDVVWLENIYLLAAFAGLPLTICLIDTIGKKKSMLAAAVLNLVGWILIGIASTTEVLNMGRLMTGVASNVAFVATPIYIVEIAEEKVRGFLSSFTYLMMLVGIILMYAVGPFVSVAVSSAVGASFLVFQLLTFPLMPDSPYYLLLKNKKDDARRALQTLRGYEDVEKEFEEILDAVERQPSEKGRFTDLILVKSNRKAMIIVTVLSLGQQFSSISVILMNIHTILADYASIIAPTTTAIIVSAIMLIVAVFTACAVNNLDRKIMLCVSSLSCGTSTAVLSFYLASRKFGKDSPSTKWLPTGFLMMYALGFQLGLGLVPSVLAGELFPTNVKAMGLAVGNGFGVLFAAVSVYLFQFVADAYGMRLAFLVSAFSSVLTAIFVMIYVPETKGKTLEETQKRLRGCTRTVGTNAENNMTGYGTSTMVNAL